MELTAASAPERPRRVGDGYVVRSLALTYRDGAVIDAHDHPWGQLVYAVRGVMRVESDALVWWVPPTRAIWLPPRREHRIAMQGAVALRTLYLAPELVGGALPEEAQALAVSPLLRELVLHVLRLGMLDPAVAAEGRLAEVLRDLVAAAPGEDLCLPLPRDPRARAAAARLQSEPAGPRDLGALAKASGASLRTLQRLFPAETGLSLEAWRQARLVHGVARLAADASVTETALDCGYESTSAFIAAFRRRFGVTPGRFAAREAR